jgi:hypothetical protein
MSTELSLYDIATKVCEFYQNLKIKQPKEKNQVLFLQSLEYHFEVWGKERDYTLKDFKSIIGKIVQDRRKAFKALKTPVSHSEPSRSEQLEIWASLNQSKNSHDKETVPRITWANH